MSQNTYQQKSGAVNIRVTFYFLLKKRHILCKQNRRAYKPKTPKFSEGHYIDHNWEKQKKMFTQLNDFDHITAVYKP